jgi:transposase-like protein
MRVGLYESEEQPRRCPYCQATNTRTVKVWTCGDRRNRHRECQACRKLFATVVVMTRDEYLLQPRGAFLATAS